MPLNLSEQELDRWEGELKKCEQTQYGAQNNCWGILIQAGIAAGVGYTQRALRASFAHSEDVFAPTAAITRYMNAHKRTWMQSSKTNCEKGIPKDKMSRGDWVMWGKDANHVAFVCRDKKVWQFDKPESGKRRGQGALPNHSGVTTVEEIWQSGTYSKYQVTIAPPPTEDDLVAAAKELNANWEAKK